MLSEQADKDDDLWAKSILTMRRWINDGSRIVVEFHFYVAKQMPTNDIVYFIHSVGNDSPEIPNSMEVFSKVPSDRVLRAGFGSQDAKLRTVVNNDFPLQTWGSGSKQVLDLILMPRNVGGAAAETVRFHVDFKRPVNHMNLDGFWSVPGKSVAPIIIPAPSGSGGTPTIILPRY